MSRAPHLAFLEWRSTPTSCEMLPMPPTSGTTSSPTGIKQTFQVRLAATATKSAHRCLLSTSNWKLLIQWTIQTASTFTVTKQPAAVNSSHPGGEDTAAADCGRGRWSHRCGICWRTQQLHLIGASLQSLHQAFSLTLLLICCPRKLCES